MKKCVFLREIKQKIKLHSGIICYIQYASNAKIVPALTPRLRSSSRFGGRVARHSETGCVLLQSHHIQEFICQYY